VFDATMYMAGPWASQLIGSLGADVLHVEQPDVDWSTLNGSSPPLINGTACGYIAWNMNKRCVSLNFKNAEHLQFAYDLIETCDVFMTNMRPLERMGLGYSRLKDINPRLIYCHATGFGRSGPRGSDRGTDAILQAYSGLWSIHGSRSGGGEFYRHATQVDATTGNLLAQAVLLGLHARKRTGRGQFIEVTMVDAATMLQLPRLAEHLHGAKHTPRGSSSFAAAPDRAFRCEDGRWIGVSATSEDEWCRLGEVLGRTDLLSDARFSTNAHRVENREALETVVGDIFATEPRAYWELALTRAAVPWGAPMLWENLRYHRQVLENEYLVEVETDAWGTVWPGGPPWKFSRTPARMMPPPIPGIDTEVVRDELYTTRTGSP
jgi:crotonobetainyl-CoA:carnitine CoA-transferase CaiB-like acyl-CoA transferase